MEANQGQWGSLAIKLQLRLYNYLVLQIRVACNHLFALCGSMVTPLSKITSTSSTTNPDSIELLFSSLVQMRNAKLIMEFHTTFACDSTVHCIASSGCFSQSHGTFDALFFIIYRLEPKHKLHMAHARGKLNKDTSVS